LNHRSDSKYAEAIKKCEKELDEINKKIDIAPND